MFHGEENAMKAFMKIFTVALVCAVVSIGAFAAKVKKQMVTFTEDVMVNGTLVKAGEYELRFNQTAGELSILKSGKVKAKVPAQLQARNDKARVTSLRTISKGGATAELLGITFAGWNQDVTVTSGSAMTGTQ
jgi:hypothetical protein